MMLQADEDMLRVLPDALDDDQRRVLRNAGEDVAPLALRGDEAVRLAVGRALGMGAAKGPAEIGEGRDRLTFQPLLRRPAADVRPRTPPDRWPPATRGRRRR